MGQWNIWKYWFQHFQWHTASYGKGTGGGVYCICKGKELCRSDKDGREFCELSKDGWWKEAPESGAFRSNQYGQSPKAD